MSGKEEPHVPFFHHCLQLFCDRHCYAQRPLHFGCCFEHRMSAFHERRLDLTPRPARSTTDLELPIQVGQSFDTVILGSNCSGTFTDSAVVSVKVNGTAIPISTDR